MTYPVSSLTVEQTLVLGTTVQTLAAGTLTLTKTSTLVQVFTGATAGQIVKMPDATTLAVGWLFLLKNPGSRSIAVQDGSGAAVATVPAAGAVTLLLDSASTVAGSWTVDTLGVLQSRYFSSTTSFATSSSSAVAITGLSDTPPEGTWEVQVSVDQTISGLLPGVATLSIYVGGVQVAESVCSYTASPSRQNTQAQVTVDGTQVIEARVLISSGTENITARNMILTRSKG